MCQQHHKIKDETKKLPEPLVEIIFQYAAYDNIQCNYRPVLRHPNTGKREVKKWTSRP
eukprot:UN19616